MVTPPRKRQASSSPSRNRSSKRPALTSSPEEGEVDDGTLATAPVTSTPTVQLPSSLPPKPLVKSKPFPFKKKLEPTIRNINVLAPSSSTDRPESARRDWEDDPRRGRARNEARPRGADHWEAGYDHTRWRGRDRSRSRSWDRHRPQQHYSPPRRSPDYSTFSPPSKTQEYDRPRERSRSRDRAYDRGRDYRRHGDGDRHYRPDDREWPRRDDADRYPRRPDSYRPPATPPLPAPSLLRPSPPSPRPASTPPPPEPPTELAEPRPPAETPPPAPPPDTRLMNHHAPLTIPVKNPLPPGLPPKPAFELPPPPATLPQSQSAPPAQPQYQRPEPNSQQQHVKPKDPPKVRVVRRREFTKRLPKQDMQAYGRTFAGCGEQSDYEVTTKLGEGTFGEVHKAVRKGTNQVVALKRILMHHEKEGMPVTALREIKILKALKHHCVVNILDMFVVRSTEKDPLSVYMVFPYMDHDLAGLLENERVTLSPSQIKLYMKQLLEGTEYMHRNHILHRDMKAANLLISNSGSLQIADFGLARSFDVNISKGGSSKKYTNCVVTRWYRPPELLLGARQYGGEVDIWGIGCVLGEMFTRRPILPGTSDLDQLEKIWHLCGTPTQHSWPNFDALPGCEGVKRFSSYPRRVKKSYESVGAETGDLLDRLLTCNPKERITATQALEHEYFWTEPLPADPKNLPTYEASHEFDKRGHRNHHPMPHGGPPPQLPQQQQQQQPHQGKPPGDMQHHHPRANGPPPSGYPRNGPPGGHGGGNNNNNPNGNFHNNNYGNNNGGFNPGGRRGPPPSGPQGSFNAFGGGPPNNPIANQAPSGPAAFRGGPPPHHHHHQQRGFPPGGGPPNGNMMPPHGSGGGAFYGGGGGGGRPGPMPFGGGGPQGGGGGNYPPFPPHPNARGGPPFASGLPPRPPAPLGGPGGGGGTDAVNNFVRREPLRRHAPPPGGDRGGGGDRGTSDRGADRGGVVRGRGDEPRDGAGSEGDGGGGLNYG